MLVLSFLALGALWKRPQLERRAEGPPLPAGLERFLRSRALHAVLGLVSAGLLALALGMVQPMIMSTLHQLTPAHRHGEAIALRSMAINLSSTLMPLGFGVLGSALGAGPLFWLMGAAVGAGSLSARRLEVPPTGSAEDTAPRTR